ncbi:MAG: hypothetical protein ACTHMS_23530 [Jatrophihabitans sp.]|uniref:hypothetical protein n=1 Tax=Jatrophihabitans sp. TaxID=1932789 RepID=UPI003F7D0C59
MAVIEGRQHADGTLAVGFSSDGACGHCSARGVALAPSAFGVFCLACCRWPAWWGPAPVASVELLLQATSAALTHTPDPGRSST